MNTDYRIYPESGDIVMEVVDQNTEYEQAAGIYICDNTYNKTG